MPTTDRSDTLVGSQIAGYRVEALIGRGGMGAVYLAQEEGLGRRVALKVIAPELAHAERFRDRFLRESRIAASLDHPHVIPILQAGEKNGLLFLAMRYVEGTDLAKLLAEERTLDSKRAVSLLEQVAEALDAAHEKGLIHRDVKPSNVLIARAAGKEHCYLADFGLTKRAASLSGVTAPGEVVGTLEYVAPEQIKGDPMDGRADVYSLACVLYECLTGSSPFPRATDVALLWAHVHEEQPPPSHLRPELPKAIDHVLSRGLSKDPEQRYGTCGMLVAAAGSALGVADALSPAKSRTRWVVFGAAAVVLAGIAAALALVLGSESSGLSSVSPNAVGIIDPKANDLVAEVPVGIDPEAVAVGGGGVWVANVEDETVSRIDPVTREIERRGIAVGDYPSDVAVGAGSVWVALGALAELVRVNPEQNRVAKPIKALGEGVACGAPRASVAVGGGFVWFVCEAADLGRVNPRTGIAAQIGFETGLLESPNAVLPEFSDVAFGLGSLWIVNRATNSVVEVAPGGSQKRREITVGQKPTAIAVGPDSLWVANFADDTVSRIAIPGPGQTPTVTPIMVGDGPVDVAVGEGGVWVVNRLERTVTRIDPDTGEVVATIKIGNEPQRIAAGEGRVWVTVRAPQGTAEP